MTEMGSEETVAIDFDNVSKRYRLAGSQGELLLEAFGLTRFFGKRSQPEDFIALDNVTFNVRRGERLGLIGRNGAGKTTLLKLIAGNYAPTNGAVKVSGSVQALMTMGQGFHPDYTGRDNINASLQYNGLSSRELKKAFEDVVDFCELGTFLDQPFKTYSSGMQARLMFGTATAIKPEILIVDEVLGAGDAYFLAKSKRRVERLVASGCTLLLVSHSMAQVLELCERTIWLDGGRVQEDGETFPIVKAYEEAMYGAAPGTGDPLATRRTKARRPHQSPEMEAEETAAPKVEQKGDEENTAMQNERGSNIASSRTFLLQQPDFQPHAGTVEIAPVSDEEGRLYRNLAPGGLSRWEGTQRLKFTGFSICSLEGPTQQLVTLQPAQITFFLEASESGRFGCTYGVAIYDLQGRALSRCWSPADSFSAKVGDGRRVSMTFNPLQLGPGIYIISLSVHENSNIEYINDAERFDLLSRSFTVEVVLPDSMNAMRADFMHSSEWIFAAAALPAPENEDDKEAKEAL